MLRDSTIDCRTVRKGDTLSHIVVIVRGFVLPTRVCSFNPIKTRLLFRLSQQSKHPVLRARESCSKVAEYRVHHHVTVGWAPLGWRQVGWNLTRDQSTCYLVPWLGSLASDLLT